MTNIPPSGPDDPGVPHAPPADTRASALVFNPDDYRGFLADGGLTPAQEDRLLEALWVVMVGFVDYSFGIHPIQQAGADVHKRRGELEPDSVGVIVSAHTFKENANNMHAAAPRKGKAAGETNS